MQYMASFTGVILVLIIISIIVGKTTKNSGIGFLVFIGLCLFHVTLAFTSKLVLEIFHPKLYEIIEPLGDDFKGFRGQDSRSFFELYQQYPDIIEYGDGPYVGEYDKKVKNGFLHELISKEEYEKYLPTPQHNYIFVRYFLEDTNVRKDRCDIIRIRDGKDGFKIAEELYAKGEKLSVNQELYIKEHKCVAVKPIYKEEVSPYIKGGKLEDTVILNIPGLLKIEYSKGPLYQKVGENKEMAWAGGYLIEYNFYGAHLDGRKPFIQILPKNHFKELMTKRKDKDDNNTRIK